MGEEIKKGLLGIVVDETTISHVVPELSALTYRGYTVQELCDKCDFEEVAYLVLNGELPNKNQLKRFIKQDLDINDISKKLFQRLAKTISNGENYVAMVHHCMALALADSGFLCFHQIARETFPAHCHPHGIDLAHRCPPEAHPAHPLQASGRLLGHQNRKHSVSSWSENCVL